MVIKIGWKLKPVLCCHFSTANSQLRLIVLQVNSDISTLFTDKYEICLFMKLSPN